MTADPSPGERAPIPDRSGGRALAFVLLVLAEYWIVPPLVGMTNYAGLWSEIGPVLFGLLIAVLMAVIVRPLLGWLGPLLRPRRRKLLFGGLWAVGWVAGLYATGTLELQAGAGGGFWAASSTVTTPFGAWPGGAVGAPLDGVQIGLNPPAWTLIAILSFLWSATILIAWVRRPEACDRPEVAPSTTPRLGAVLGGLSWAPIGFVSSCAVCTPIYLAPIGLLLPGVASAGYAGSPFVPWIGLSGLLYIGSLTLALVGLRRATRPTRSTEPPDEVDRPA